MDMAGAPIELLTTATEIQVNNRAFKPNAALALIGAGGGMLIGVGSDHGQAISKPLGRAAWRYAEIADHMDRLMLRSSVVENGIATLLQEDSVASVFLKPDLKPEPGTVIFCVGPAPVAEPAGRLFEVELKDPVLNRSLKHRYSVQQV